MTVTLIENIVVPEIYDAYIREDFLNKSALIRSGAVVPDARLNAKMLEGGFSANLPFFVPNEGDDQVITEGTPLTANSVSAKNQVVAKIIRGNLLTSTQLAAVGAGEDIVAYIRSIVGEAIIKNRQTALVKSLTGLFATALTSHVNDISGEDGTDAVISADALIDTMALMGDNYDKLALVAMHSSTFFALKKAGVLTETPIIDPITQSTKFEYSISGANIIVDDNMPVTSGVYTTYLLGRGAVVYGSGLPSTMKSLEDYNDVKLSESGVAYRDGYILHPVGCSFTGTPAGATPTNVELATAGNWALAFNAKNIPMAAIKHLNVAVESV